MEDPHLQHPFASPLNTTTTSGIDEHHILTGSFRSLSLFLLAFSPRSRRLRWVSTLEGQGPHQYLAKVRVDGSEGEVDGGKGEKEKRGERLRVYATSWAWPPMLHSWALSRSPSEDGGWKAWSTGSTPITAVSSYISVPPPYGRVYSVGGPTGEVHDVDERTGGWGGKVQEVRFVRDLEGVDKTRAALRYGSHAIEFTPSLLYAFVPVLGTSSIEMFAHDPASGRLTHLTSVSSPRGEETHDGPRHVKVHPNGGVLYCVTEHNNFVDAYRIDEKGLGYISSRSLLPSTSESESASKRFRGDTLMLEPSRTPSYLITTTRGADPSVRGWLGIFALDTAGAFTGAEGRYETPTSGGKANAIDLLLKDTPEGGVWIVLTDDDEETARPGGTGAVRVLEWDGWGTEVRVVAEWPEKGAAEEIRGASHAIWLD